MLFETFKEMISEGWVVPVYDGGAADSKCWYLPFFVTKQEKPRVVFDGAATFDGTALKDAVFPGINLLNNGLVDVLTRFRKGRYACMADLSKCFLQVSVPENQRDLFRLVWFKNNDIDEGEIHILKFTRHVWGVNSSPYIALFAIEKLVAENPTNASNLTLSVVETNRFMDDLLLSSESLEDLETISWKSVSLFQSRGFKLRTWVCNSDSKSVLTGISNSDLGSNIQEIDLGSQPMPDSEELVLVWYLENDKLRVLNRNLLDISTRREMLSSLTGQFDPLGILAPCLPEGKLILRNVATLGLGWDDELPQDILKRWR